MKLLLDENLPKRLKIDLDEHEIYTVADKGWTGISNGKLLELLIQDDFDAPPLVLVCNEDANKRSYLKRKWS